MSDRTPTTLYRLYGRGGELLYVGIATSWPSRMKQHSKNKAWWDTVTRVEVEGYPARWLAADAESRAIAEEQPLYNEQHSTRVVPADETDRFRRGRWTLSHDRHPRLCVLRVDFDYLPTVEWVREERYGIGQWRCHAGGYDGTYGTAGHYWVLPTTLPRARLLIPELDSLPTVVDRLEGSR